MICSIQGCTGPSQKSGIVAAQPQNSQIGPGVNYSFQDWSKHVTRCGNTGLYNG